MHGLANYGATRPYVRMAVSPSADLAEQQRMGAVIRRLREANGLNQSHVGPKIGMTTQGYQKYEAGERKFTPDRLAAILLAIGVDRETFDMELANEASGGARAGRSPALAERGRSFVYEVYTRARAGPLGPQTYDTGTPLRTFDLRQVLGPNADALEVAGDSMTPWAEPGEMILFDRDRHPRRGSGCVVETKAGEFYVKLYEKTDGANLWVKELFPEEKLVKFSMADLAGIYAVMLRGD